MDSNYFLRQREIESKILEPKEDEETEEEKDKRLSTQRKIINAQLEEQGQKISRLITFRNIFYTTGLLLTTILVVSTLIIVFLFLLFPKNTAKWFGYRSSPMKIARTEGMFLGTEYDSNQGIVLGAEYDPDKKTGPKNLLAKIFKPISQISLGVVKQINPETYYQIVPQTTIEDVNDVLNINAEGEISTLYNLTFPDTSYLHIPDKNLINNLNADYLRGKVPGQNPGDLAVLDAQNFIEGLKITESNISGQITNDILGNAVNVTGIVQVNHGGTGQTSFSSGQLLIGNAAGGLTKSTLTAGDNIVITNGDGSITIASTAQASTGANVGTAGVGIYRDNTGIILNFKNINVGSNKLSAVDDVANNEVDLDVVEANIIHNNLSGLTTGDVHTQYLFLNGRAGGQIVIGGTGAGENLTLQTTSNVVKGSYILSDLATGIVTSTAGTLSATATGDLTAGSNKIVIGGIGTNAVLGAGVSVDVDQTKLALTVSQISDIATNYLKLDASNDPLGGDLSLATNKLIFGTGGAEDTNLYRSSADTLKTDDAFASGVSVTTPIVTAGAGNNLTLKLGDAAGANKFSITDSGDVEVASINSDGGGYFAGNIGIKDTDPITALQIKADDAINLDGVFNSPTFGSGYFENFCLRSESFDNASWIKTDIGVVTANSATAPNGLVKAENIPAGSNAAANIYQQIARTDTGNHTFAVWLKSQAGTGTVQLRLDSSAVTGTAKTVNLTTTWKRYAVSENFADANTYKRVYIISGTQSYAAWGASLERLSYASNYYPTLQQDSLASPNGLNRGLRFGPANPRLNPNDTADYMTIMTGADISIHYPGADSPVFTMEAANGSVFFYRSDSLFWSVGDAMNFWKNTTIKGTNYFQLGDTDNYQTPALTIRHGGVAGDPYLLKTYALPYNDVTQYQVDIGADNGLAGQRRLNFGTSTGAGGNTIKIGGATTDAIGFYGVAPAAQQSYTAVSNPPTQAEVTAIRNALVNLGLMASQ